MCYLYPFSTIGQSEPTPSFWNRVGTTFSKLVNMSIYFYLLLNFKSNMHYFSKIVFKYYSTLHEYDMLTNFEIVVCTIWKTGCGLRPTFLNLYFAGYIINLLNLLYYCEVKNILNWLFVLLQNQDFIAELFFLFLLEHGGLKMEKI